MHNNVYILNVPIHAKSLMPIHIHIIHTYTYVCT